MNLWQPVEQWDMTTRRPQSAIEWLKNGTFLLHLQKGSIHVPLGAGCWILLQHLVELSIFKEGVDLVLVLRLIYDYGRSALIRRQDHNVLLFLQIIEGLPEGPREIGWRRFSTRQYTCYLQACFVNFRSRQTF